MVSVVGWGCKQYREQMDSGVVPELSCPDPECRGSVLRGHGWYRRYLAGERQRLRRVRCPRCRVSHAVLPEDVCAYRDLTFDAVEAGLAAERPSAGARSLGRVAVRECGGCAVGCAARRRLLSRSFRDCWDRSRVLGGGERRRWWEGRRVG